METYNMPTYRFEYWPDISYDDPDCQRLMISTLPYFDLTVWPFEPTWTDAQKIEFVTSTFTTGLQKVAENPVAEPFAYKIYRDEYLVGIFIGHTVENGEKGKTYFSVATFLGEDENGSRDWTKKGTDAYYGLEEFMNQYGITYFAVPYAEGHAQIARHTQGYGVEPDYIEYRPNFFTGVEEKVYVFGLFELIKKWKTPTV